MKKLTIEQRERLEDSLIDDVIGNIKKDIEDGDVSAIFELLRFSPVENLIGYLPDDLRANKVYKPLLSKRSKDKLGNDY